MNAVVRMTAGTMAASLMLGLASTANAGDNDWEFELSPYLWAAGVDADVQVGNQTTSVDASFSDIVDALDIGAAILLRAQRGPWVVWTQFDYFALSTDELDDAPANGRLDSDIIMLTAGFGREFASASGRRSIDVLLGVRYLELDNTLRLDGIGTFDRKREFTDAVIILRPSFQISERWRLNPTFSFGGGDSEGTYELQPQVQYQVTDSIGLRFGYRRLYYDIESEAGHTFDGSFHGPFIGIGGTFGN